MFQVADDSFVNDDHSKYHGRCRYDMNDKVSFPCDVNYYAAEYIHAL